MRISESQLRRIVNRLLREQEEKAVPDDAPGNEQVHLFDFDDTLGETLNANAVMLYRDGKPVHKSEAEVKEWLKTMGIGDKDLLDPKIVAIPEKDGAYAAYITSSALAKVQTAIPKDRQFVTGYSTPAGKSGEDEVLVDFTPSAGTDPDTTKPIKPTIDKLKAANAKGAKTAVVTARSAKGDVVDIHGKTLKATNEKDMLAWLDKQGAKPNAGVFGVSGGNKGEKIKKEFIPPDDPPEEVHFYDDLGKNTSDVESAIGGQVPSELFVYGPGEFAHGGANPEIPAKSYPKVAQKGETKKESVRSSDDLIVERWGKLAGIIKG